MAARRAMGHDRFTVRSPLLSFLALSFLTVGFLTVGCGGRLDPDDGCPEDRCVDGGFDGAVVDSTFDGGVDTGFDTGPGLCGSGPCTPGTSCKLDCNTCSCFASGEWACTGMACIDSGFDTAIDTTPPLTCPTLAPPNGAACTGFLSCAYSNGCGGKTFASCDGARWNVKSDPCTGPTCPVVRPIEKTSCKGPIACPYVNSCGGTDTVFCDATSSYWRVVTGGCPPPPPVCPKTKPPAFSPCTGSLSCAWDNGCGEVVYGYCDGKSWNMKEGPCSAGCPGAKPTSGAACKPLPGTSCRYISVPGTSCTTQCFCADDGRWACVTPPCSG